MDDNRELLIERMADNLPVLRKKLKMTQEDLGDVIGMSRYTVMLIETKKRKLTWNNFLALMLLFEKNENTKVLVRALDIYTDGLDLYLKGDRKTGV